MNEEWINQNGVVKMMSDLTNNTSNLINMTKDFFNVISEAVYYLSHPAELAQLIWSGVVEISFVLCLALCFAGIVLHLVGYQKGSAIAKISFFSYLSIQVFNSLL